MARPREPIDLLVAKGKKHLTKEEIDTRKKKEIAAPSDDVKPPVFLSKKEKERFIEISDQLIEIGIMSNLDCESLARYVRAESEYEKITKQLSKIKFAPDKKSGTPPEVQIEEQTAKYNYLQKIQVRATKQVNECARDLGLTISSRCKLTMPKVEEKTPENKYSKFIG